LQKASLYQLSFIGLSIIIWLYLIIRGSYNPLVFDEATSYFLYIKNGTFWPGQAYWSANNHLLNSFLGYLSISLFGSLEWALRLPNILAFPLYAFFGLRLMSTLHSPVLRWWALVLFFTSHGIIEFFGYARGYGLMLSFLLASLWHLRGLYFHFQKRKLSALIAFSFLALLSNVSCLPLASLILITALYLTWQSQLVLLLKVGISLLAAFPIGFTLWWTLQLKSHQQLYYGGQNGFTSDSLQSLKAMMLSPELSLDILLAAGALFSIAIIIGKPWRHFKKQSVATWCVLSMVLITAFYPLAHWSIGLNFPFDRALIYWLVFGLLAKFVWLDQQYQVGRKSMVFFLSWTLIFPLLFFGQVSLNRVSFDSWSREQIPDSFYKEIQKQKIMNFGGSYLQAPQWNFLQQKFGDTLPAFQVTNSPLLDMRLSEKKDWPQWQREYYRVDSSGASLYLLQRKRITEKKALATFTLPALENHKEGQLIYQSSDTLTDAISGSLIIKAAAPLKMAIALQAMNEDGEQIYWQAFRANDYLSSKKGWQDWRLFVILKDLPQDSRQLRFFIWNPENEAFSLKETEWSLWELK